jgi:hypothetical protein
MTTTGRAGDQPSDFVSYDVSEDIAAEALFRAVKYDSDNEGEVLLGTDDGTGFAGIIYAVTAARTPYGMISGTGISVAAGTRVTVVKSGFRPAIADGTIKFGDALCMGESGKLKTLEDFDTSPTALMLVQFVGRAQEDAEDGDSFIVDLRAQ